MKHLQNFQTFLFEFNLDISSVIDKEIAALISRLAENSDVEMVDDGVVEIKTPSEINAGSGKDGASIFMDFSPDLLRYRGPSGKDELVPWIKCSITLEGQQFPSTLRDLLNHLADLLKSAGYTPFKDEDALHQHWRQESGKGYNVYSCFVNPDFPQGYWQNHAI
jgi:hypothetical protein